MKLVVNTQYGKTIKLGIPKNEANSYVIDWGDGSDLEETVESNYISHVYTDAKEYTVTISGVIKELDVMNQKNLIKIEQWGELGLTSLSGGFMHCTNLTEIASPTKNSFKDVTNFSSCFNKTGITSIPENLFANCPNVTNFSSCFNETGITSIPENLFANCPNVTDFSSCFYRTGITSIPENLFANCPNVTDFNYCFYEAGITNIPEKLFENCPNVTSFSWCFSGTEITSIPEKLFKKCSNVSDFSYTFYKCSKLEKSIPLWDSTYYSNGNNALNEGTMNGVACFARSAGTSDDIPEDVLNSWFAEPPAD